MIDKTAAGPCGPPLQSVKKVEVQEALPPAGVIGAAPLTLVPQHFPPQTSVALFAGNSDQFRVFRQAAAAGRMARRCFFMKKKKVPEEKNCREGRFRYGQAEKNLL